MISFEQLKTVSSAKKGEDIAILDWNREKLSFEWETATIGVIKPETGEDLFRWKKKPDNSVI